MIMANLCQESNQYLLLLSSFYLWSKFAFCEIQYDLGNESQNTLPLVEKYLFFKFCFKCNCVCIHIRKWNNPFHSKFPFFKNILLLSTELESNHSYFLINVLELTGWLVVWFRVEGQTSSVQTQDFKDLLAPAALTTWFCWAIFTLRASYFS